MTDLAKQLAAGLSSKKKQNQNQTIHNNHDQQTEEPQQLESNSETKISIKPDNKLAKPAKPVETKTISKQQSTSDALINSLDRKPGLYIMIGKSDQGKSYLMKHVVKSLAKRGDFQLGIVFAATKFNNAFDWIQPQNLVISGYKEEIFKRFLQKLQKQPTPSFVIFEDLAGVMNWHSDPFLINFINTYRHYKLSVFILNQYAYQISPNVREQCKYAFLFRQKTKRSYEACYENFGTGFDNYKDFKQAFDAATKEEHYCMVVASNEEDMEKRYGRYKAPEKEEKIVLNFAVQKKK